MNFKALNKNSRAEGFALIKKIEVRTSAKGDKYLDLLLGDSSGEIVAKYWDYREGDELRFPPNSLVKVRGQICEFKGAEQFRIELIRAAAPEDNVDISAFIKAAEYESDKMYGKLFSLVESFKDRELGRLCCAMLEENREKLLYFPAALRLHHAMLGGLLYHTLSVTEAAEKICELYPFVDRELLLAGAVLHDLGKLNEIDANSLGIACDYTAKGKLLGHLYLGAQAVRACGERLGISDETLLLIEHMLLSHHGLPEFGSPIRPMFTEAMILNTLDELDAHIYEFLDKTAELKPKSFSDRIKYLDDRRIYNSGRVSEPKAKAELF